MSAPQSDGRSRKPRLLLSAFACDPKTGSEPYVGWNWATMLADDFDLHVLTRRYSLGLIGDHALAGTATFHGFDLPFCGDRDHHWRFIKPYYIAWQICALFVVLGLNARHRYALVQHATYNNLDVPGFLWLCPGARFVWGPVGGGQTAPASLKAVYGRTWWKERLRGVLKGAARYNPIVRAATRRASLVFFANGETEARLAGLARRTVLMLETAVAPRLDEPRREHAPGPVRVLWLSHIFPRKGLDLALDAFIQAHELRGSGPELKLIVVGGGPDLARSRLKAEASAAAGHIEVLGAVPHDEVRRHMEEADIFLFTSVQDTSGNVVLEAMRDGLPVIALDHQGAKAMLSGGGGRLVPIGSYADTVRDLASAILALAAAPDERARLGRDGWRRTLDTYSWSAKRETVVGLYRGLLGLPAGSDAAAAETRPPPVATRGTSARA